VAGQDLRPIE